MAEHVFESDIVEEFYNSCHGKDGRFCSAGAKGKGIKRVPMSDAARASNAAIRGKAAKMRKKMAAKQEQSKGAMAKMSGQAAKVKRKPEYGSGKTDPEALKVTQKYGTRQAGGGAKAAAKVAAPASTKKVTVKATPSNIKYGADKYGTGKTNPAAAAVTAKYGTRRTPKPAPKPQYGSGKTEPSALEITKRFGTRRG